MCRATAGPLIAIVGVAGTFAGVAIAVVRERVDRLADARAAKDASDEQDSVGADNQADSSQNDPDDTPSNRD